MRLPILTTFAVIAVLSALHGSPAYAQAVAPRQGTVEHISVHGASLEGNLTGDSPDRMVSVYLPPSYATERNRRYPVVYLLHGFTDSDDRWFGRIRHFISV